MRKDLFLGIDIGSVTVKTALFDANKALLFAAYTRIKGDPAQSLVNELTALASRFPEVRIEAAGITGSGGKQVAEIIGARFVNEILAQASFAGRYHPRARTIIEGASRSAP